MSVYALRLSTMFLENRQLLEGLPHTVDYGGLEFTRGQIEAEVFHQAARLDQFAILKSCLSTKIWVFLSCGKPSRACCQGKSDM